MLKAPLPPGSSLFVALWLVTLPGFAAEEKAPAANAMTIADSWTLPGLLGGGVKTNDAYTDGHFFLTFPAYNTIGTNGSLGGDVIFIEPYSSWGEQGEVAVSLGLGWRHLFSQQSTTAVTNHDGHQAGFFEEGAFIGANLFVDLLDTQFDNRFWQLGFGIEAGTRYLEVHANYYLPLSDRQLALEQHSRQTFTTRNSTIQRVASYGEPYGEGHTIAQDSLLTTTRTTVTTTTTVDRISRLFEDGMEGWEIEAALLVPGLDRWADVKILAGYYSYDNQPFGPQAGGTGNVEGWKAGLEVRPVPAVVLNATWYEDERLTGDDWVAGVRFELPFEAGDLGDGKGFWDRIGDAFRPRRRHLAERMIEPVRRQNAAVKVAASVEEEQKVTQKQHVTKEVSQISTGKFVLADTVVFVDNAIGQAGNPGTYEAPLDTISNGAILGNAFFGANAIVMVQGRPQAYTENVVITQGVRMIGSGSFPGLWGKVYYGRTKLMPLVNGGFLAQNVQSPVAIKGFEITGGLVSTGPFPMTGLGTTVGNMGIVFDNVAHGIIAGNIIHGMMEGIFVESSGAGTVSEVLITDNIIRGNGDGIALRADASGHLIGTVKNNLITGNTPNGLVAFTGGVASGGTGVFTITGNTFTGNLQGLHVGSFTGNGATFLISSNLLTGNTSGVQASGNLGGTANVFLSGNTISFNSVQQIYGQEVGGTLNFISIGALSNTVLETPGDPDFLYEKTSGSEGGLIFINGFLHPANVDLP